MSLIGYTLKPMGQSWAGFDVDVLRSLSIPIVALLVWLGARRVRKSLHRKEEP